MNAHCNKPARSDKGFTLMELIVVITILTIAAVPILSMFGGAATSLESNLDLQTASQLNRECAELILAQRRDATIGYTGITNCSSLSTLYPFNGFTAPPAITITDPYTGAGCPGVENCKLVEIVTTKASVPLSSLTLMLVNY